MCWWESDIRQLQGQRTTLCRKPWEQTHTDDLTVCHSGNKVTKNNHTYTQTQKVKAITRTKAKFMDILQNSSHALTPDTNTYQCKKRKTIVLMWLTASHLFWNSNGHPMKYRSGQLGCWILSSTAKTRSSYIKNSSGSVNIRLKKSSSVLIQSVELFYLSFFFFFCYTGNIQPTQEDTMKALRLSILLPLSCW